MGKVDLVPAHAVYTLTIAIAFVEYIVECEEEEATLVSDVPTKLMAQSLCGSEVNLL